MATGNWILRSRLSVIFIMRVNMRKIKIKKAFTLVELLVSIAIFTALMAVLSGIFTTGRNTWFTTDANIQLQENLRQTILRLSEELRETGSDKNGVMQVTIGNNTGVGGSDTVKFSVPIICHNGDSLLDVNGDVTNWGAHNTWGCTSSSCMDGDDSCTVIDYKYIQYEIDANGQLLRKVLNGASSLIKQDIFAQHISDFQVSLSVDNNVISLAVTASRNTGQGKIVTRTDTTNIYLRNQG